MRTRKVLGGVLLAVLIKFASDIASSLVASGFFLLNVPECVCIAVMGILYLAFTVLFVKLIYGRCFRLSMEELGMPGLSLERTYLIIAVLLPAAVCGAFLFLIKGTFVSSGMDNAGRLTAAVTGIVYNGIAAAFAEEILFRGVILGLLRKQWNTAAAVIVPSVLFGLVHIMEMQEFSVSDCVQVTAAGTLAGIMFSVIAVRSGSVWNSGIVHAAWNMIIAGGFLVIGMQPADSALMTYVVDTTQPLLTGGVFGAEASVIAMAGYVIVAVVVCRCGKSCHPEELKAEGSAA